MDPFLGEIRMFAGNFAPMGWALCNGQIMQISQNQALYSLLGVTYGGNGTTTFALPDLRSRVPLHAGTGAGLSPRNLGQPGGYETVTLNANQMPQHAHTGKVSPAASDASATAGSPNGKVNANFGRTATYADASQSPVQMAPASFTTDPSGMSQPHENMPPFLPLNFIIALEGIYPTRG